MFLKHHKVHEGIKPPNINISDTEMKVLRCDINDGIFSNDSPLTEHIPSIHEGMKPFTCTICTQIFF